MQRSKIRRHRIWCILGIISLILMPGALSATPERGWTVLYYAAGSNSSEQDLLQDIGEMIRGKTSDGYTIITLIDRIEGYSSDAVTLGEDFTDTRLYRLESGETERLDGRAFFPGITPYQGSELNMGDAGVLRRFIQYGKTYYPADQYLLILRSHGNGVGMCEDLEITPHDRLYPAEIQDSLSQAESVDILGLDVCSMAGLETLYEWRPTGDSFGAAYVVASAPLSAAWAYDAIFKRIQSPRQHSIAPSHDQVNPAVVTPEALATLLLEEINASQPWASWGVFANRHITTVKRGFDSLATSLVQEDPNIIKGYIRTSLGYFHQTHGDQEVAQLTYPYRDAFDFVNRLADGADLLPETRARARSLATALDRLVMDSYYGTGFLPEYPGFLPGKHGVYLILPEGDRIFTQSGLPFWAHVTWYHPERQVHLANAYGAYDWCREGAVPGNGRVENWFEYMDALFDTANDTTGGVNQYQW